MLPQPTGSRQQGVRNRPSGYCFLAIAYCLCFGHVALADTVHQRGGLPSIDGRILKIEDAGITIDRGLQPAETIRWDVVREVTMDRPDSHLQKFLAIGETLWRARTRLERHDPAMAEPLFERLFETYRGQTHETAWLVAEGLLRCRLARGAHEAALIPALETSRIRRAMKATTPVYANMASIMDDRTLLCTALPPVWIASPGLTKLERDLSAYKSVDDPVIADLAALYRSVARRTLNLPVNEHHVIQAGDHPGVSFMRRIVEAISHEASLRENARKALRREIATVEPWTQAWTHYFVGVSSLLESDPSLHERGLVDLVHVPARFGNEQPYLSGLALAKLAQACDAMGETSAAASLRQELLTRFPNHPAAPARRNSSDLTTQAAASLKDTL